MESLSSVTASTLDRAASAGPRRNSMEDSDSSLTRKRPRLDSGSRSYRSMSADPIAPSTPTTQSHIAHVTPSQSATSAKSSLEGDIMPPLEGTPSRVTINVRDSISGISHHPAMASADQPYENRGREKENSAKFSDLESSRKLTQCSPDIGSASSSPSRSPEIEVAEVEDINEEPGNTRWRPLRSHSDPAKIRDDLWAMFPCRDRAHSVLETSEEIIRHIQQR